MNAFTSIIDINKKLSPEHHVALHILDQSIKKNDYTKYEDLKITEYLINQFNYYMSQDNVRKRFEKLLHTKSDYIVDLVARFKRQPWLYAKPIIWSDRDKSSYFIDNLVLSHRFEKYIEYLFEQREIDLGLYYGKKEQYYGGENALGIEIKRDIKSWETGNLYIEYAERENTNGPWVSSGIDKIDNTNYFWIGDIGRYHILRKADLRDLHEELKKRPYGLKNGCKFKNATRGTSMGYIIPMKVADTMSLTFDQLVAELTFSKAIK